MWPLPSAPSFFPAQYTSRQLSGGLLLSCPTAGSPHTPKVLPMLAFPEISPIAFSIGAFHARWYGIMYLLGFGAAWLLARKRLADTGYISSEQFELVLFYGICGVMFGARLGYILFYDLPSYLHNPLAILKVWEGGMSFHGGLLGVLLGMFLAARKLGLPFFGLVDFVAPLVPPGLFFGRMGNFINGELWGRVTEAPWGMVFPHGGPLPRHPSQLYEAFFEGIALFVIVWAFSSKKRPIGAVSGVFALGYGIFRCLAEFFREPDEHIGYLFGGFFTMGMALCLPLMAVGVWLLYRARRAV